MHPNHPLPFTGSRSGESGDKVFAYTSILAALLFTVILRALRHRARKVAEVFRIATYCIFVR